MEIGNILGGNANKGWNIYVLKYLENDILRRVNILGLTVEDIHYVGYVVNIIY